MFHRHVLSTLELLHLEDFPIVAPDFRHPNARMERQLRHRATRDVDLNHEVGWRVFGKVNGGLPKNALCVRNIEARIGLEATVQIRAPEGSRAGVFDFDVQILGGFLHERGEKPVDNVS